MGKSDLREACGHQSEQWYHHGSSVPGVTVACCRSYAYLAEPNSLLSQCGLKGRSACFGPACAVAARIINFFASPFSCYHWYDELELHKHG